MPASQEQRGRWELLGATEETAAAAAGGSSQPHQAMSSAIGASLPADQRQYAVRVPLHESHTYCGPCCLARATDGRSLLLAAEHNCACASWGAEHRARRVDGGPQGGTCAGGQGEAPRRTHGQVDARHPRGGGFGGDGHGAEPPTGAGTMRHAPALRPADGPRNRSACAGARPLPVARRCDGRGVVLG